jgi:ATP-dependent Clp protease ATP-binding subunit ClpB
MQYPSQALAQTLLKANSYLKEFNDEYVSIEHLLLALLSANDETAKLLNKNNVTETNLKNAIKELAKRSNR